MSFAHDLVDMLSLQPRDVLGEFTGEYFWPTFDIIPGTNKYVHIHNLIPFVLEMTHDIYFR